MCGDECAESAARVLDGTCRVLLVAVDDDHAKVSDEFAHGSNGSVERIDVDAHFMAALVYRVLEGIKSSGDDMISRHIDVELHIV